MIGLPRKVKGALEKARDSALLAVEVYTKPAVKFGDFVARLPSIQFARSRTDCDPSFPQRRKSFR